MREQGWSRQDRTRTGNKGGAGPWEGTGLGGRGQVGGPGVEHGVVHTLSLRKLVLTTLLLTYKTDRCNSKARADKTETGSPEISGQRQGTGRPQAPQLTRGM